MDPNLSLLIRLLVGLLASAALPAAAETAVHVFAGGASTCAVTSGGQVRCWGANWLGQLGDGTTVPSSVPVAVSGLGVGVSAVTTNELMSCGLSTLGAVLCWGWYGAPLGGPTPIPGLASGVAAIDAGTYGLCALTTAGSVMCEQYDPPIFVGGLAPGASAISQGGSHSCAIVAGGARCWGLNAEGQLGEGGTIASSESAVPVLGLSTGVVAVTAGGSHSCALGTGSAVWCWGANEQGQLGNEDSGPEFAPVAVPGLPADVTALAAGSHHTCALTASGGAWCWGSDQYGQLGDGDDWDVAPGPVSGLTGAEAISSGGNSSCAITSAGALYCWGHNSIGQLGNGTTQDADVPVAVVGFEPPPAVPAMGMPWLALLAAALLGAGASRARRPR